MPHIAFHPASLLRSVYGTGPFLEYCSSRGIPFRQRPSGEVDRRVLLAWEAALACLPRERAAQVGLDLAAVCEMGREEANTQLLEAAGPGEMPPSSVPAGAPLALWFLLRRPGVFNEVFLHHEIEQVDHWHVGRTSPGIAVATGGCADYGLLAEELRAFFGKAGFGSSPCVIDAHLVGTSRCVAAQVGGRVRQLRAFTDGGEVATERLCPARTVLFLYEPEDGTVLLSSRLRSRERVASLLSIFGRTVLGRLVVPADRAYDLDVLKRPFRGLPDAPDMESVRVKSLCLRYPARDGRRQVRLDTVSTDAPAAIEQMLRTHVPAGDLDSLRVSFAELQVRLRLERGTKNYAIRLWPDRSNLGETELGDRFRACLRRWGISHAR
jgi:hypothetical protein